MLQLLWQTFWLPLSYFVMGFWLTMFVLSSLGTFVIGRRYSKKPVVDLKDYPPVTILRPLKGIDVNLIENLKSSFMQNYPKFEIIFMVADASDPAVRVVNELMALYPHIDASLLIGKLQVGVNPKINNLAPGYDKAKYDILWIVDSNIWVEPGCLGRSVLELSKPGVGLVHHLPCGLQPESLGSRLELAFLNSCHAKMYIAINSIGIASCIVGKSNLLRKSDLERVGGLRGFGCYMSEDNVIGTALWNIGLKHRMGSDLAFQSLGSHSVMDYFRRRVRWIRIRKYAVPVATLVEPLTESLLLGIVTALSLDYHFGWPPTWFLLSHFVYWITCDFIIMSRLNATYRFCRKYWMTWFFREVCALPLYLWAIAGTCVEWRGNQFQLFADGTVKQIDKKPFNLQPKSTDEATQFTTKKQ